MRTPHVLIVGGGCSGSLLAVHLVRACRGSSQGPHAPCRITIVEKAPLVGLGRAYAVPSDRCVLNVPVGGMSAFANDPDHFFRWMALRKPDVSREEFVSRRFYGLYLNELLRTTRDAATDVTVECVQDEVVDIAFQAATSTFQVRCAATAAHDADACVLALGNIPRSEINGMQVDARFRNPYDEGAYVDVTSLQTIGVLGTGLTAVDCVVESEGRGFTGQYVMVSRHGRLPLPHEVPQPLMNPEAFTEESLSNLSLRELVRRVSREARRVNSSQGVMNAIRPHVQAIWRQLSMTDKRRFLRHVRPLWEVHRHRVPKSSHDLLQSLHESQRLRIKRGHVGRVQRTEGGVAMNLVRRGKQESAQFDALFLCVGPESDLSKVDMPLLRNLLASGLLAAGGLGLGVADDVSSLPSEARSRFRCLGPLQREALWEITAVRELRVEAEKFARELCVALAHTGIA